MRPAVLVSTAAAVAALVAGCGGGTTTTSPTTPVGLYPSQGVRFATPEGWSVGKGAGDLVATLQTGQATVAIWRFARHERLPQTKAELAAARDALLTASHDKDATFAAIKTAPTTVAGRPAVQIRARETIAGQMRTVRSTHIYADGAEYIVDAYSDADSFRSIDATVFRPLLRSLRLTKPQGAA